MSCIAEQPGVLHCPRPGGTASQDVLKIALTWAKQWYHSSSACTKSQPHAGKPPSIFGRKKQATQWREPRLPKDESSSIREFREGMARAMRCPEPVAVGAASPKAGQAAGIP